MPQLSPSTGAMETRETMPSPPGLERGNNSANVLAQLWQNPQAAVLSPWTEADYSPIGRRPELGAGREPRLFLQLEHDVLRAFPEAELAELAQILPALGDGEEMIAGELADL